MLNTDVDLTTAFYSLKPPRQGSNLLAISLEKLHSCGIGEAECEALCSDAALGDVVRGWAAVDDSTRMAVIAIIRQAANEAF